MQARRQLNWNGGGGMDSQHKVLSELLSDQATFITSPKTSLGNYWGALPPAPQCLRACLNPYKCFSRGSSIYLLKYYSRYFQ